MQFDKRMYGTMYKNVGRGWKTNINLRSSGLKTQIKTHFFDKGGLFK